MRPAGSRALSSSALANLLERTRSEAERVRNGTAAAAATGLLTAVASASSGTLADSVTVLMRRKDTRGKPLTAANQWRRYCRDKHVAPWPVTLPKLQGYLVWRLATETRSSGRLFKASGPAAAICWLKRYALARGTWELTVAEEALLARVRRVVPMHVPASRTSTRVLSTAELVRLVQAMRLAPPSAHLRLARAVLALAVTLQSRGTELRRARMRDFVAAPEGVVVSVVFGKVAGNRSEIPRHLIFGPHLAGELAYLCPRAAYQALASRHLPGYTPAWHDDCHMHADRPLLGLLAGEVMTASPLPSTAIVRMLEPYMRSAGLDVGGMDAHFGRATGGSLLEFGVGLDEETVALMAGRGVHGSVYRSRYRNLRSDAPLFATHCGARVAAARGEFAPTRTLECCD